MHVVTILRHYLGLSQMELAERSGVSFADINEMENKPAYGMIDKYCKVAKSLQVPLHAVAMNDILSVPETFFQQKRKVKYKKQTTATWAVWGRSMCFRRNRSGLCNSIRSLHV